MTSDMTNLQQLRTVSNEVEYLMKRLDMAGVFLQFPWLESVKVEVIWEYNDQGGSDPCLNLQGVEFTEGTDLATTYKEIAKEHWDRDWLDKCEDGDDEELQECIEEYLRDYGVVIDSIPEGLVEDEGTLHRSDYSFSDIKQRLQEKVQEFLTLLDATNELTTTAQ